jgi:pyruvate dehydrogenase E1 component beta subunit
MGTVAVTDQSFEADVLKSGKPVLVDFWAEWCGPCKQIAPALEQIASELGEHVTVVAIGRMVSFAEKALDALAAEGITADLIDPRTLSPLDDETIYESLENTGRLVIVDESPPRCSVASDIAALVASNAFHALKAPIVQITAPHTPVPFARELERAYVPSPQSIEAAIRRLVKQ